jgi:hypothetical protein
VYSRVRPAATSSHTHAALCACRTRSVRYPPPNGETLTMEIIEGQQSCEVIYDGTSAPTVRATQGTCGAAVCTVQATYSSPCRERNVTATARVWVVAVECLLVRTLLRLPWHLLIRQRGVMPDDDFSLRALTSAVRTPCISWTSCND